uniref:Papilinlike [Pelodiscus sinensis] n=2 Tax=Lepeophtheirus salmonis TaxID=72036 RepID=A0A0K2TVC7_LEPSM
MYFLSYLFLALTLSESISSLKRNNPFKSRGASLLRDSKSFSSGFYNHNEEEEDAPSSNIRGGPRLLFRQIPSSVLPLRSSSFQHQLDPVAAIPSEPVRSVVHAPPRLISRLARRREYASAETRVSSHSSRLSRVSVSSTTARNKVSLTKEDENDPCSSEYHRIIANEPQRSFNHHLSIGEQLPICDRSLSIGWYRFESPAGNILATECPGGNYCGTQMPVWMKGHIPKVSEGIVDATGCVNQGRECCTQELPMRVKNCSSHIVYHLQPTPGCHMGYCVGEGVPCKEGLTSTNGYTPCNFSVQLDKVHITQGALISDVVLFCNPVFKNVNSPSTVVAEIKWWVNERLTVEESFNLKDKKVSTLLPKFWKLGQKIRCSAEAKHEEADYKTDKKMSNTFVPGVQIFNSSLTMEEGGHPAAIKFFPTIPIMCDRHTFQSCCVEFQVDVGLSLRKCPNGEDKISFPDCSEGKYKICQHDWNKTHEIPIAFNDNGLIKVEPMEFVTLKISTQSQSNVKWQNYHLSPVKIKLMNSDVSETCSLSGIDLNTFDGVQYKTKESGAFILYKHRNHPYEIVGVFQPCSLRENCLCSLVVKAYDSILTFDLCSKRHLIVGGKSNNPSKIPKGFDLLSVNDGREYKLYFPTGTWMSLDSYLLDVKIYASKADLNLVYGLCGNFDRNPTNEFGSHRSCPDKCKDFFYKWRATSVLTVLEYKHPKVESCSLTGPCMDTSSSRSVLKSIFKSGTPMVTFELSKEKTEYILATPPNNIITDVSTDGVITPSSASTLCNDYIGGPHLDHLFSNCLNQNIRDEGVKRCSKDVLHSGEIWIPQIYVERFKSECRNTIFRNISLWERGHPPAHITNKLCINDCNGNGECYLGNCICKDEYTGRDCSINVEKGKPQLYFLENEGLCDVRTKPCRNVGIISSGLDRERNLICSFEIYKIRGVASKQLVNDGFFNKPAEFVSYQKFNCPIPKLDIHNPQSLANFDLKDNTDHTRLYIKISASYAGNGHKSAPLDLLLYDSSCWNCTTTECTAKKSDKCFFASGSSSIQVFRLGKSIATLKSTGHDEIVICTLPKNSGGCSNKIFRYYYNAIEQRCKLFVYGGCKGNGNNFLTERQCLLRCGEEGSLSQTEITTEVDTCSQKRDEGICPGNVPRFYFDKKAGRCLLFSYGGCGGNSNNFENQDECIARCGGPKGTIIVPSSLTNGSLKPRKLICSLQLSRGNCQATLRRFYFDEKQGCKLFIFGGCQGNDNNFETMEDCIRNCGGPNEHGVSEFINQLREQSLSSSSTNLALPDLKENSANVCSLPKDFGHCMTVTSRYYYDPKTDTCKKFRYSGCGGNTNNFRSGERCIETCGGLLEKDNRISALTLSPFTIIKATTSSTSNTLHKSFHPSRTPESRVLHISTTKIITTTVHTSTTTTSTTPNTTTTTATATVVTTITTTTTTTTTSTTTKRTTPVASTSSAPLTSSNVLTEKNVPMDSEGVTEKRSTGTSSSNNRRVRVRVRHRKRIPDSRNNTRDTVVMTSIPTSTSPLPDPSIHPRSRKTSRFHSVETPAPLSSRPVSVVLRTRANKDGGVPSPRRSLRRMDSSTNVPANNVTRAEPSGVKRFPSSFLHHRSGKIQAQILSTRSTTSTTTTTTTAKALMSVARSRTRSGFLSFLHKMRHSASEKNERISGESSIPRSSRRISIEDEAKTEEISSSPSSSSLDASGLVVVRSFCRFPPFKTDLPRCRGENPLFYYNVTTASCVPFYDGYCGHSRNRFLSQESCLSSCIVQAQGFATNPSNRHFLRFNQHN